MNPTAPTDPDPASPPPPRNRHRVRRWIPYLGAVLLLALIVAGLWPQPVPIETARVSRGLLRVTVNEEGKTRIQHRYQISAPVTGQLQRIPFKAGATVQAGDTLARIDPIAPALLDARTRALLEARRDAAVAQLDKARATRAYAATELLRNTRLHAAGTVSDQELETAQWRDLSSDRELDAAESALREAEAELTRFDLAPNPAPVSEPAEVRSPISGRVLRVFEDSARVVAAGTPLLDVGDPTDLEVIIEVLSRDGATIPPGTRVLLEQWGGELPLEAVVRLVEPAGFLKVSALGVEEQRVNVIADIVTPLDRRPGLGDGFRVEGRIITWEEPDVLKVPTGALFRRGSDWATFVLEHGRARTRILSVGASSGMEAQVLDGLREGDEVIVYPGDRVKEGLRVQPIQVAP
ncbi:MAG: efflux RND transporter periplasmic adaptor subunit [Verrucomicrobia bacterium]|nr:efflux RND transporter periplasmic adaptor subunit [Verrucomicrobiota bacterium]